MYAITLVNFHKCFSWLLTKELHAFFKLSNEQRLKKIKERLIEEP